MNNIKYYNDSLAYDFEMFMPHPKTVTRKRDDNIVVKLPKTREKAKARKRVAVRRLTASAFAVLTSVIILAALCGNIFLRLRINEVNSEINSVKNSIAAAKSEKTALSVKIEREISFSNIELEATELGMQKMDKNQVKYIRVNEKNTAVTKDGKTLTSSTE
ncbi:MAG: hypothetical protein J5662_02340 [Clostridia bacterium]|nr:hypothetical protein [Clostridia bacterium]